MMLRALQFPAQATVPVSRAGSPTVALEDVSKHYESGGRLFAAVSGISLDIWPGELTVVIGPSGSGKTTLLSLMGGILRPTQGRVVIGSEDISALPELERSRIRLANVGFVFQHYNLFPALTAQQNVEIALDLKGIKLPDRCTQARDLLGQVGLDDKAEAHPADLSGGQKQRVAIARALAGNPSILLADEPTAALDFASGRRIIELFHDLTAKQERAVVVVTHDSRIVEFADRIIRIEDGRIAADGSADRVVGKPAAVVETIDRRPFVGDGHSPTPSSQYAGAP